MFGCISHSRSRVFGAASGINIAGMTLRQRGDVSAETDSMYGSHLLVLLSY